MEEQLQRKPLISFAVAAYACGILAIITTIFMTVYLPFVFGGLSIIFAVLSKTQRQLPMEKKARIGMTCGTIGMCANIVLIVACFILVFTNAEFRSQINDACMQMYGITFDQMLMNLQQR